jgi:CspA family cold shock protein
MKGRIKFFNESKGYGFIKSEDGKEYFFHQSDLRENVALKEEDEVSFSVADGDRGPKAENVTLIKNV